MVIFALFRTIRRIYTILSLILLAAAIYIGLLLYTGAHSEIKDVHITSVSNVTRDGFILNGELTVYNGGLITIDVSEVTYAIDLEDKILGEGIVEGQKIRPKEEATFAFHHYVNLSREIASAMQLKGDDTNLGISGTVVINHFGLYKTKIPYKTRFDLLQTLAAGAQEYAPVALAAANSLIREINGLLS